MTNSDVQLDSKAVRLVGDSHGLAGRRREIELGQAKRALAVLKKAIDEAEMLRLLRPHLERGDATWKDILARSNGFTPSKITLQVEGITAEAFMEWFFSSLDRQEVVLGASPEHYRIQWESTALGTGRPALSITESAGGVLSKFTSNTVGPELALDDVDPTAIHIISQLRLDDGTMFGGILHQFRNCEGGCILELGVYFPSAAPDTILQAHREHLYIEWLNWIDQAVEEAGSV